MRYLVILLVVLPLTAQAVPVGNKRVQAIKTVPLRDRDYGYPKDEDGNEVKPEVVKRVEKKVEQPKRKVYKENSTYNSGKSKSNNWDFYDEFYSTDFPSSDTGSKGQDGGSSGGNFWGY